MANIEGVRLPGIHAGREQSSADALARARRLVEGAAVRGQGAADAVELSPEAGGIAAPASAIEQIDAILASLRERVEFVRANPGLTPGERQQVQQEIDESLALIDRTAVAGRLERNPFFGGLGSVSITGYGSPARLVSVYEADLSPGEQIDINVAVTQSAQTGSLLLNFGGGAVRVPDALENFVVQIGGRDGAQELSFASGTTLAQVAAAINTFVGQTGVEAFVVASGLGGVALRSVGARSDEFVSVRVLNDGGAAGGVFRAQEKNFFAYDPATGVAFDDAALVAGVKDDGQDLGGTINGVAATLADDYELLVDTDGLAVSVRLFPRTYTIGAFQLGSFRAATIRGEEFIGVGEAPADPLSPVLGTNARFATARLGYVGRIEGARWQGALDRLGSGRAFNVVNGDLDGALLSVDRARLDVKLIDAQDSSAGSAARAGGAEAATLEDPAGAAAEVRRTLFSRSWQTILAAIGGAPRADRFG